nr:hypothetical protein [Actinoalloteichus fjordicus]
MVLPIRYCSQDSVPPWVRLRSLPSLRYPRNWEDSQASYPLFSADGSR